MERLLAFQFISVVNSDRLTWVTNLVTEQLKLRQASTVPEFDLINVCSFLHARIPFLTSAIDMLVSSAVWGLQQSVFASGELEDPPEEPHGGEAVPVPAPRLPESFQQLQRPRQAPAHSPGHGQKWTSVRSVWSLDFLFQSGSICSQKHSGGNCYAKVKHCTVLRKRFSTTLANTQWEFQCS